MNNKTKTESQLQKTNSWLSEKIGWADELNKRNIKSYKLSNYKVNESRV